MTVADRRRCGGLVVAFVIVLGAGGVRGEDDVLVNVTGPLAGNVGDRVKYEVELVNRSGRNLEKLRIVDYFDAGFHHEASKSPVELKGTIDLAAGTQRRIELDFLLDEPGRQCHRVEVLDPANRFVGGATECVQVAAAPATPPAVAAPPAAPPLIAPPPATVGVTPTAPAAPSLALDLTGPQDATSGAVAEFAAIVRNTGNAASPPTTLSLAWDDGFTPLEASDGYALASSKVTWNLPPIEAGGQAKRQINLRAQAAASAYADSDPTRSCVRAEMSGLGGALLGDQECVRIRSTTPRPRLRTPAEAGLRITLADLDDPVRGGVATTLVCTVVNDGAAPSGPLSVVVDLPRGARLVGDSRSRVDGGRVSFDPVDVPAGRQQS
ncbi:MAG: hypothetical protein ACKOSQ_04325, partial [Planctomycetaceae bacterium]